MTVLTVQVEANADDGDRYYDSGSSAWVFSNSNDYNRIGADNQGMSSADVTCYFRFQSVGIPAGATIDAAKIQYKQHANYTQAGSNTVDIHAEDADSAGAIGNDSQMTTSQGAITSAKVTWTPATSTSSDFLDTADFKAVIQEVIDRGGWSSGNDIVIHFLNPTDAGMMSQYELQIKAHEVSSGADAVKLVVTYTAAAAAVVAEPDLPGAAFLMFVDS